LSCRAEILHLELCHQRIGDQFCIAFAGISLRVEKKNVVDVEQQVYVALIVEVWVGF
jgi:hypothetical protein